MSVLNYDKDDWGSIGCCEAIPFAQRDMSSDGVSPSREEAVQRLLMTPPKDDDEEKEEPEEPEEILIDLNKREAK